MAAVADAGIGNEVCSKQDKDPEIFKEERLCVDERTVN